MKQHFAADIAVAVVVTEGALQIGRLTRIERIPAAIEARFRRRRGKQPEQSEETEQTAFDKSDRI